MKNILSTILSKKWIGPLALLLYTLCSTLCLVYFTASQWNKAFPVIAREINNFLPITIQNGEITHPQNTLISKSYSLGDGEKINLVLDTRTDTLNFGPHPDNGIYISKKCIYTVSSKETKTQCMKPNFSLEPLIIDETMVKDFAKKADTYFIPFLSLFLVISLFIVLYIIILFYTVIMHWITALVFQTTFGQTLLVNTLAYIACCLLEPIINIGFIIKLILFIGINFAVCKIANERK